MKLTTRSTAGITPATFNPEKRSVQVIAATEAPTMVWDWDQMDIVPEVLIASGCILPASRQVPLLDSHSRHSVSNVLGSARNLAVIGDRVEADVFFCDAAEGLSAAEKVRGGHVTDFSAGYSVQESVWIPEGQQQTVAGRAFEGPLKVTTRWEIKELSLTPIGADPAAKARSINEKGVAPMDTPHTDTNQTDAIRAAVEAERERCQSIQGRCRVAGLPEEFARDLIERGIAMNDVADHIFRRLEELKPPTGAAARYPAAGNPRDVYTYGADAAEKRTAAIVDGLVMRAGFRLKDAAPGANEYLGASLVDIAKEALILSGERVSGYGRAAIARQAMTARSAGLSDFPALMAATADKVLRLAYDQAPSTWQLWCSVGDAIDYKEMSRNQLSEAPELELIREHGEYQTAEFSDAKEVFQIHKYGRVFRLSREAVVNDDLQAFLRIPKAFALAARRRVNEAVYGILTANANMADGNALFSSAHDNLAAGGNIAVVGIGGLNHGRKSMRLQTGLNGVLLNIQPKYLIVPAAVETAADTILNSMGHPDDNKNAEVRNPFAGKLDLVVDPILDADSVNAWYLAADSSQIDTVEVAFLDGQQAPYIEDRERFEDDSREWKVRLEFGAKAIDWRGLYKNPGVA